MYGVVAIELAASIAPWTSGGAPAGTLAWLSEMYSALWPGVSGAGAEAGAGDPVAAICSEIEERLLLSADDCDSSSSRAAWRAAWASLSSAKRAAASARAAATSRSLTAIASRASLISQPDGGHPLDRGTRFVAQALDPGCDRVVVALDLAQVVGAGADFRPARRFEHDVEHVGAARLVNRDEPFPEHLERPLQACPDLGQMSLVGLQLLGRRVELALLRGEFVLDRHLLLAQVGDFAEHRVDRPVLFGDRVGQRAFAFPHVGELALGRVVLLLQRLRGRGRTAGCQQRIRGREAAPPAAATAWNDQGGDIDGAG